MPRTPLIASSLYYSSNRGGFMRLTMTYLHSFGECGCCSPSGYILYVGSHSKPSSSDGGTVEEDVVIALSSHAL